MITSDMIAQANATLHELMLAKWLAEEVFSIRWWGIAGFLIFSYVLCFTLMDKKRLSELILFGSLVSVFSVVIDVFLSSMNAYIYKAKLLPIIPTIFIYDITALPLYFMLIYQHSASWKEYAFRITLAAALMGFVFTPLLVWLGYLQLIHWNYVFAFLVIGLIGFLGKGATASILYIEKRYQAQMVSVTRLGVLQPAMKPLNKKDFDENKKDDKS